MKKWFAVLLYAAITICILYEGVYKYPRWNKPGSEAVLAWDVSGYYFYLPAFLIYKDPARLVLSDSVIQKYRPGSGVLARAIKAPNGNYIMKYTMGMALLYLPWFAIAHCLAHLFGYPADCFSYPYQLLIGIGCMFYAFVGLFLLRWVLRKYYSELAVALTLFVIAACSNFLCYASTESANAHAPIFMIYAFILFFTYRWYRSPRILDAFAIGFFIGWAVLCRPIDILSFLIPVLWQLDMRLPDIKARINLWVEKYQHLFIAAFTIIAIGSIQMVYWKIFSGHFLFYTYWQESFQFLHPHIAACLFSFRKGWFIYSPVMILIVPGYLFLYKDLRRLFLLPFVFFAMYAYASFSWSAWWYGGAFGQRELVQAYALLAFPIASFFQYVLRAGVLTKVASAVFIVFCWWLNMVFMYQADDVFPWEATFMTRSYFLKIFGRTEVPSEYTLFLDHDEEYTGDTGKFRTVYKNDFDEQYGTDEDSVHYFSTPYSLKCNRPQQLFPAVVLPKSQFAASNKSWFRVSARFLSPEKEWTTDDMTKFIVSFQKDQQAIKEKMIRPQRALEGGQWKQLHFDIANPAADYDSVKIIFVSADDSKPLYMDDLQISVTK